MTLQMGASSVEQVRDKHTPSGLSETRLLRHQRLPQLPWAQKTQTDCLKRSMSFKLRIQKGSTGSTSGFASSPISNESLVLQFFYRLKKCTYALCHSTTGIEQGMLLHTEWILGNGAGWIGSAGKIPWTQ